LSGATSGALADASLSPASGGGFFDELLLQPPAPAAMNIQPAAISERAAYRHKRISVNEDAWGGGGSPAGAHRGRVWEPSEGSHLEHRRERAGIMSFPPALR
jgi:hypothetical protein